MPIRRLLVLSFLGMSLLACGMLALGAALVARSLNTASAQPSASRIVYGLTLMPSGFDPHINASAELTIPLRSVYDTLIYRDPQSTEFVPGLAERLDISPDGLTYTFYLRSGVKFHDGESFDAAAVGANLDRITSPETKSQKALYLLGSYAGYTVVDPLTIEIKLSQPYAPLLDGLAQPYLGMASPKALAEYDRDRYQLHQVGTGPYRFVEYVPGDYLLLARNPDYAWGPPFYRTDNMAPAEEIEFRFFTDPATRAPALETGAVDVVGELAPVDALALSRREEIRLAPKAIPGMPFLFFLNTTRPPTDKVEMRRALLIATDRVAITDSIFQQYSPPAYGPLSAVTPYYDPLVKNYYPHDRDGARLALQQLGYADSDGDKLLDQGGTKLSLIMLVPAWGFAPQIAQKVQAQWRDIGIELELRQVPGIAALREALQTNEYHLLAFNDFGVDASVLNSFFRSDAPNNWSKYIDGTLDGWLNRATTSIDPVDRQTSYTAIQQIIMEQALILPIRDYVNLNGAVKRVEGLAFDAYGWSPLLPNLSLQESP